MSIRRIAAFLMVLFVVNSCSKPATEPPLPGGPPVTDTPRVELNAVIYAGTVKGTVCAYDAADGKIK